MNFKPVCKKNHIMIRASNFDLLHDKVSALLHKTVHCKEDEILVPEVVKEASACAAGINFRHSQCQL
jgi:hypothetical protein